MGGERFESWQLVVFTEHGRNPLIPPSFRGGDALESFATRLAGRLGHPLLRDVDALIQDLRA